MNPREKAGLVATTASALLRSDQTLSMLPNLIKQLLEEEVWKGFEAWGRQCTYTRFEDFVAAEPPFGLGASVELIERIVKDDPETVLLLRKVLHRPEGRPQKTNDNVSSFTAIEHGNSQSYALQRLEQDRPDLLEQVKAGNLTPHGAMVKAGFRRRVYSVNLDSPQSAHTLIEKASPAFLDELRKLLNS